MNFLALDDSNRLSERNNTLDGSDAETAIQVANALSDDWLARQNRLRASLTKTAWTILVTNGLLFQIPIDTVLDAGDLFAASELVVQSPGIYEASADMYFHCYQPIAPLEPLRLRMVELFLTKNGVAYSTLGGITSNWFFDATQTPLPLWEPCRLMSGEISGADWVECKAGDRLGIGAIFTLDTGYDVGYFNSFKARMSFNRAGDVITTKECCS